MKGRGSHVDTNLGALEVHGVNTRRFERLPGHLEADALLGVHRQRLTPGDFEETIVESGGVFEKRPAARDCAVLALR